MRNTVLKSSLSLLLVVVMLFSNIGVYAETTYEQATKEGEDHGKIFGEIDGKADAESDYNSGLTSSDSRHILDYGEIIDKFNLDKDDSTYRAYFIKSYLLHYSLAYQSTYRELNINALLAPEEEEEVEEEVVPEEPEIDPLEDGTLDGISLGSVEGIIKGAYDFSRNSKNDWQTAFDAFVKEESLAKRYKLGNEPFDYWLTFEQGFKDAFKMSYIMTYRERHMTFEKMNINLYYLGNNASEITFSQDLLGIENAETDNIEQDILSLSISKGAVYQQTPIQIYKKAHIEKNVLDTGHLEAVSDAFTISIVNEEGSVEINDTISLRFNYNGSEYAGIYLWKNNRWEYQYTTFEDGLIQANLPKGQYLGGTYAIFVDANAKGMSQATYHWARQDAYTLMRRGVVEPEIINRLKHVVTRREFAQMAYKALGDNLSTSHKIVFADQDKLGESEEAINYLVANNYMFTNSAGAFRPDAYMSYRDVERLLSTLHDREFLWEEIANPLLHDKYVLSHGLKSIEGQINMGEIIYTLSRYMK